MSTNPGDPRADQWLERPGRVLHVSSDIFTWGKHWLRILENQEGIIQVWIGQVDEQDSIRWIANSSAEILPDLFSAEALQNVIQRGQAFTFKDHTELFSGGLFPLVKEGQVIGVIGLLGNSSDYFKSDTLAWIRTLTRIISDSLMRENFGDRAREAEQAISRILHVSLDIQHAMPVVLEILAALLEADAVLALRYNSGSRRFELLGTHGVGPTLLAKVNLYIETGPTGRSFFQGNWPIWIQDLQGYPSNTRLINRLDEEGFRGYLALPLFADNDLVGALEVAWRAPRYTKAGADEILDSISKQIAFAMERTNIIRDLRQSNTDLLNRYHAMIEGLSRALELRDLETVGHTRRVSALTMRLVEHMQIEPGLWDAIRMGALLHDIGKIGIPDAILLKPGSLTAPERKVMEQHVLFGYNVLVPVMNLRPALDITLYHHERWDGLGYPHGLRGEQIPLVARLFAVVDVFDALTSDRPYRPAWSRARALEYLKEQSGTQFDAQIVRLFLQIADEKI